MIGLWNTGDTCFPFNLQAGVLERRLFYMPSFKIYGSVAGFYDYGPPGCAVKQYITQYWRQHFVLEEDMLQVNCSWASNPACEHCICAAGVHAVCFVILCDSKFAASMGSSAVFHAAFFSVCTPYMSCATCMSFTLMQRPVHKGKQVNEAPQH